MFLFIIKYEWLLLKASKMLLLLAGITTGILFFALYDGYKRITFQQQTLSEISSQQTEDYAKYRAQIAAAKPGQHFDGGHFGDPTNPFYFGSRMGAKYAVLPPAPLSIIAAGQSDIYPYYYKITLYKKQALYHNEELENPQILFNGRFDVSFVIIFLLPLLIIAFTYNIYSGEKEAGTLPLLMSQNTSVDTITGYRFLFQYLLFNVFFSVSLLTGLVLFGVRITNALPAVTGVIGITWLYTGFWFALAWWVNSFKKTSGFAATTLTGSWLLLVLIIPTIISSVIDVAYPVPSRLSLITQTRNISDNIAKNSNALNRFLEDHPEFKPANADPKDRNGSTLRNRIEVELAMEKTRAGFNEVVAKREAFVNNYRFLSPAVFVQQLLNTASGTNDGRYKTFDKQVSNYQQQFRSYFEPLVYRQQKFTATDVDKIPAFVPAVMPVFSIWEKEIIQDILCLAALMAAVWLLAFIQLRERKSSPVSTNQNAAKLKLQRRTIFAKQEADSV